jgi:hypothetical protein
VGRAGQYAGSENDFELAVGYLPPSFMCGGTFTGHGWKMGGNPYIPKDVVLYHANYCVGLDSKIDQLRYVRDVVRGRGR